MAGLRDMAENVFRMESCAAALHLITAGGGVFCGAEATLPPRLCRWTKSRKPTGNGFWIHFILYTLNLCKLQLVLEEGQCRTPSN
jgi:hypothetical protein